MRWPKRWSFSFSISPSNEYNGLISFRIDWLDLLAVLRDSQESSPTPQFKSVSSLALNFLCSLALTFMHDYWKNHSLDYNPYVRGTNEQFQKHLLVSFTPLSSTDTFQVMCWYPFSINGEAGDIRSQPGLVAEWKWVWGGISVPNQSSFQCLPSC